MNGILFGLALAIALLVALVAYLADEVIRRTANDKDEQTAEHAKCIAHIADMTSKRVVAMAFRDAAERFDSTEEVLPLTTLRRSYKERGPSVPAMWMRQQADRLDPQ